MEKDVEVTIRIDMSNPNAVAWLEKIRAQMRHPQYQGGIRLVRSEEVITG